MKEVTEVIGRSNRLVSRIFSRAEDEEKNEKQGPMKRLVYDRTYGDGLTL